MQKIFKQKCLIFSLVVLICFIFSYVRQNLIERHHFKRPEDTLFFESNCNCQQNVKIALYKYATHFSVLSINEHSYTINHLYDMTHDEFYNLNLTCNMYDELRRGKFQKVFTYSLFGQKRRYYKKLISISQQIKRFFPAWSIRIYHDNQIKQSIICKLKCAKDKYSNGLLDNVDFCNVEKDVRLKPLNFENLNNSYNVDYILERKWRFFAIIDSFVEVFSSRDTDSYVLQREVDSVNFWLDSRKVAHIMKGSFLFLLWY
jgi:hypothetical protein